MNKEIVDYFTSKGLTVDWDFTKSGSKWYEFSYKGKMLCQIDFGVPLETILQDLRYEYTGEGSKSEYDYIVSASGDRFTEFCLLVL
jgi:hypothetical protein